MAYIVWVWDKPNNPVGAGCTVHGWSMNGLPCYVHSDAESFLSAAVFESPLQCGVLVGVHQGSVAHESVRGVHIIAAFPCQGILHTF